MPRPARTVATLPPIPIPTPTPAPSARAVGELARAAGEAAALLRMLANPDRLLLLCRLVESEANVSTLEARTGIRQPTLSQQLAVLRDEDIVRTRRDGKFIYYRIASEPALALLRTLHATFCDGRDGGAAATEPTRQPELCE